MAQDSYWAYRPANQSKVIGLLKEALFSTDIKWDESQQGYMVKYNHYLRDFKFPDPQKYGQFLKGPGGKELTKRDLDLTLITQALAPSGQMKEVILPESLKDGEFLLRPDYVQQADLESLRDAGKQQKAKYAPPPSRGYGYP